MTSRRVVSDLHDYSLPSTAKQSQRGNNTLRITPSSIRFTDCVPGQSYYMYLQLLNVSSQMQRIRLQKPLDSAFVVDDLKTTKLNAGMSVKVRVQYTAPNDGPEQPNSRTLLKRSQITTTAPSVPVYDNILVISGDVNALTSQVKVPLVGMGPCLQLNYNPVLDMGHVSVTSPSTSELILENSGQVTDMVHLVGLDDFRLSSESFELLPSERKVITVETSPEEVGSIIRVGKILIGSIDKPSETLPLTVQYHAVEENLILELPEYGPVSNVDFQTVFYGQKKTVTAFLVNNSPRASNFRLSFRQEGTGDNLHNNSDDSDEEDNNVRGSPTNKGRNLQYALHQAKGNLAAFPEEGKLAPYERKKIKFVFSPQKLTAHGQHQEDATGFKALRGQNLERQDYVFQVKFEVNETKQRLNVSVVGEAIEPALTLSHECLAFNTCHVDERRDMIISIESHAGDSPLPFAFSPLAQFRTEPSRGVLRPGVPVEVRISFQPRNLGAFRSFLKLNVGNGLRKFNVEVTGKAISRTNTSSSDNNNESISTKKNKTLLRQLPEDFEPEFTAVQPKQRKKKFHRTTGWKNEALTTEFDGKFSLAKHNTAARYTFTGSELEKKQSNKSKYDNYLVESQKKRANAMTLTSKQLRQRTAFTQERVLPGHGLPDQQHLDPTDEIGMGMGFASGLESPRLALPPPAEYLHLNYPMSGYPGVGKRAKATVGAVDGVKRRVRLKKEPTTQAERRDCELTLSLQQLSQIHVGPKKKINFGTMSMHAWSKKQFSVSNDLNVHILVEIDYSTTKELLKSSPSSQMIPPGESADFNIFFQSDVVQAFKKTIHYAINKQHHFNFLCVAEVVPVSLDVSSKELHFLFNKENLEFFVSKTILVENPANIDVDFWLTCENDAFVVEPSTGTLSAFQKREIEVRYQPKFASPQLEEFIQLHVKDGPVQLIKCTASLPESKLTVRKKKLNYGLVSVGLAHTKTVTLYNDLQTHCIFNVHDYAALPADIQITPHRACIDGLSSIPVQITLSPTSEVELKQWIQFDVRGRKHSGKDNRPQRILLTAQSQIPNVCIREEKIDFDSVTIGSKITRPLSLVNDSDMTVIFFMDLSYKYEFSVDYPAEWNELEDCPITRITTEKFQQYTLQHSMKKMSSEAVVSRHGLDTEDDLTVDNTAANSRFDLRTADSHHGAAMLNNADEEDDDAFSLATEDEAYKITVKPHSAVELGLVYSPQEVLDHSFELPIQLAGLPHLASVRRRIRAQGLRPKISIQPCASSHERTTTANFNGVSGKQVDFAKRIVLKREKAAKNPYVVRFDLKNEEDIDLDWVLSLPSDVSFDLDTSGDGKHRALSPNEITWRVEPMGGTLLAGQVDTISVYFSPLDPVPYETALMLYLVEDFTQIALNDVHDGLTGGGNSSDGGGLMSKQPYLKIALSGVGSYPSLSFDTTDVMMPQVPLGFESKRRFYIYNNGYENLELQYKNTTNELAQVPLLISFPEGNTLALGRKSLPVDVAFVSKKPNAFSVSLAFYDTEENFFPISIHGVSDSSILSTQRFLTFNKGLVVYDGSDANKVVSLKRARTEEGKLITRTNSEHTMMTVDELEDFESRSVFAALEFCRASDLLTNNVHATPGLSPRRVTEAMLHSFPSSIVKTGGKLVFDLVRSVSGKNPLKSDERPGGRFGGGGGRTDFLNGNKSSHSVNDKKLANCIHLFKSYQRFLTFLKSHGALLNGVKPEYLLSLSQYLRLKAQYLDIDPNVESPRRQTKEEQLAIKRHAEETFPTLAKRSWMVIIFQVIKIFVLQRVTPKSLRNTPGVPSDLPMPKSDNGGKSGIAGSNVYTTGETVLLNWLTYHHKKQSPHRFQRVTNFDTCLADGLVFTSLFNAHVPNLHATKGINFSPSRDQWYDNCSHICYAMEEIGLPYAIKPEDMCDPVGRNLLLFVVFLYNKLPSYLPKTTIEFKGRLNVEVMKKIELSNPTRHPIHYTVRLTGTKDFSIRQSSITLGPKDKQGSRVLFPVYFTGRFSRSVTARLTFLSSNANGSSSAQTMVFLLKSQMLSRQPVEVHQITGKCYEMTTLNLMITNPYMQDCQFSINGMTTAQPPVASGAVVIKPEEDDHNPRVRGGRRRPGERPKRKRIIQPRLLYPPSFWCKHDKVRLRQGEKIAIPFDFLPLRMGKYSYQIVFINETYGEFMHQIDAVCTMPAPIQSLKWNCDASQVNRKDILVAYNNPPLDRVRRIVLEKISNMSRKQRETYQNYNDGGGPQGEGGAADWVSQWSKADYLPSELVTQVKVSSPYFQIDNKSLTLRDDKSIKERGNKSTTSVTNREEKSAPAQPPDGRRFRAGRRASVILDKEALSAAASAVPANNDSTINLSCHPRGVGVYKSQIVLTSKVDVRVLSLEVKAVSQESEPTLEFKSPAGQELKQNIPITNNSKDTWQLRIQTSGSTCFSAPAELIVGPKSTVQIPLSFTPIWMNKVYGRLEVANNKSSDVQCFELVGEGDEPRAEDTIKFECKARQRTEHMLHVYNRTNTDAVYAVESDLPDIGGADSFTCKAKQTAQYQFTLFPQQSGSYNGSIRLINKVDNTFMWYALQVTVTAPPPQEVITIDGVVRKASAVTITLSNPTDETVTFAVEFGQVEGLFGPDTCTVEGGKSTTYEFVYSPLVEEKNMESAILFVSPLLGEFWYKLILSAEAAEKVTLTPVTAHVGSHSITEMWLENPMENDVVFRGRVSNPLNFSILDDGDVYVPAFSKSKARVQYTPSSIDKVEECDIVFSHPYAGKLEFSITGQGLTPHDHPETIIAAPVKAQVSGTVAFRNPFPYKLPVAISLDDIGRKSGGKTKSLQFRKGVFELLTKKKCVVPPLSSFQISFSFFPDFIDDYTARLAVKTDWAKPEDEDVEPPQELQWTFPIKGIAEGAVNDSGREFKTAARSRLDETFDVKLFGLDTDCVADDFYIETYVSDRNTNPFLASQLANPSRPASAKDPMGQVLKFFKQSVNIDIVDAKSSSNSTSLRFNVVFEPLRQVKMYIDLILYKRTGGRWKYPLRFLATEPDVDDVIKIVAPLNKTSNVSFGISNQFNERAEFKAFFTSDSPRESFEVTPKHGVLPSLDSGKVSQFLVSFTPKKYGKETTGFLVIETDVMQWTYEVRGVMPKYQPPEGRKTISTFQSPDLLPSVNVRGKRVEADVFKKRTVQGAKRKAKLASLYKGRSFR